jgi:IS1381, transposase orfA
LPKKRELVRNTEIEAVVDATECEIESLKKTAEILPRKEETR